ncbi:rhodanese-like domain-containing protein [Trichormus sp. NMC-1]|uniref:rhodanese-like domain-containing protein n=1 Tax=Trichormus sp. NMC-1 TaxID=1853259 RepID=UPI0008DC0A2F|nr:rhodanese-like domain-containing protein [Trichormus sp. NMC-1]
MTNNVFSSINTHQQSIETESDVHVIKSRLEWGEPAFTILDVRDRSIYNEGHIMGAMSMPIDELADRAALSLDHKRDIYVYGMNEEQTAQAAQILRAAGFLNVSQIKGGFGAWKAIGGATEGIIEALTPAGADDYNVVSRIQNHLENQQK